MMETRNPCKLNIYRGFLVFALSLGGERGIRTPGTSQYNGFQDRRNRPLCHLSLLSFKSDAKEQLFFVISKLFLRFFVSKHKKRKNGGRFGKGRGYAVLKVLNPGRIGLLNVNLTLDNGGIIALLDLFM